MWLGHIAFVIYVRCKYVYEHTYTHVYLKLIYRNLVVAQREIQLEAAG